MVIPKETKHGLAAHSAEPTLLQLTILMTSIMFSFSQIPCS